MPIPVKVEFAHQKKIRQFNKGYYRVLHWPIWIWVFFLAPGPLTFDLFAHGPSLATGTWLALVLLGTGIAGWFAQLPGVEPKPYILRFTEDRPNPMYRKVCYTFAWADIITFATLNLVGLIVAVFTGKWNMKPIYDNGYFPLYGFVLLLGAFGILPRVRKSTEGEGIERRYFYGSVWAVTLAQTLLMILWKVLPRTPETDVVKLVAYVAALAGLGICAAMGLLPRTRPILPGELIVGD
ncbi:MAG TPA: hypothetical protein VNH18_32225 [Bryobacteraceae bacterium]|nr:hypothetical protein [Bryobacteraceae bacterium]